MDYQDALFNPINNVETITQLVHLSELPSNEEMIGEEPKTDFIKSILELGQIEPILLRQREDGSYEFLHGSRRIKAFRKIATDPKWRQYCTFDPEYIEAKVVIGAWDVPADILKMALNAQRQDNTVMDYFAITELVSKGLTLNEIQKRTGMPIARQKKALKLGKLGTDILEAVRDGRLSISKAGDVAKLSQEQREIVVGKLKNGERVSASAIQEAKVEAATARVNAGITQISMPHVPVSRFIVVSKIPKGEEFDNLVDAMEAAQGRIILKVIQ